VPVAVIDSVVEKVRSADEPLEFILMVPPLSIWTPKLSLMSLLGNAAVVGAGLKL